MLVLGVHGLLNIVIISVFIDLFGGPLRPYTYAPKNGFGALRM